MCKPDIVYKLDRGYGLRISPRFGVYSLGSMPVFCWLDLMGWLFQDSQDMVSVTDLPVTVVDLFESDGFFGEHFGDVEASALPLDLAVVAHLPDSDVQPACPSKRCPYDKRRQIHPAGSAFVPVEESSATGRTGSDWRRWMCSVTS